MNQWKRAGAVLTAMTIFIGTTGSALALEDFEAEPAPQQEDLSKTLPDLYGHRPNSCSFRFRPYSRRKS